MNITSAVLAGVTKGYRKLYDGALAAVGRQRIKEYAFVAQSQSKDETYAWLGALPGMRKLVGEINIRNLVDHGFAVENEEFEVTVAVKRKDIERDKLALYNSFFTGMGMNAGRHPDKLLAAALVGGFTKVCYTGKYFFDANHEPQKGKVKFSNKGTKKLSAANFQAARESIIARKDAEGEPINDNPDLVLIVSPKWEQEAKKILVSETVPNAAGTASETNVNKGTARIDVWNRLSGAATEDMWFLIDFGAQVKPFVHQVEVPTEFTSLDSIDSERAMLKKEYLYQAYGRYTVAALLPELCYGSTGVDNA